MTGIQMDVWGKEELADIFADFVCLNNDSPAAYKFGGCARVGHDTFPCLWCNANVLDINQIQGYDMSTLHLSILSLLQCWFGLLGTQEVDDQEHLCQSFFARDAEPAHCQQILDFYGVWWTPYNLISDWLPSWRVALNFMYNIFLGEVLFVIHHS